MSAIAGVGQPKSRAPRACRRIGVSEPTVESLTARPADFGFLLASQGEIEGNSPCVRLRLRQQLGQTVKALLPAFLHAGKERRGRGSCLGHTRLQRELGPAALLFEAHVVPDL